MIRKRIFGGNRQHRQKRYFVDAKRKNRADCNDWEKISE
jgi:hypothetical protein